MHQQTPLGPAARVTIETGLCPNTTGWFSNSWWKLHFEFLKHTNEELQITNMLSNVQGDGRRAGQWTRVHKCTWN